MLRPQDGVRSSKQMVHRSAAESRDRAEAKDEEEEEEGPEAMATRCEPEKSKGSRQETRE